MPNSSQACNTLVPGGTSISIPSMISLGIRHTDLKESSFQKSPLLPSFRKIRFFALACKNVNLCGIRFGFFGEARKLNRIPHKRAFCEEQSAYCGMTKNFDRGKKQVNYFKCGYTRPYQGEWVSLVPHTAHPLPDSSNSLAMRQSSGVPT